MRAITNRYLPIWFESSGRHDEWPLIGWAMLARACGTLDSIMELLPWRRAADAAALNRTLYEHVVTFAWIAIDPAEHRQRWLRWERRQRIKTDNDLQDLGGPALLDPATRQTFEAEIAAGPAMPDALTERATAVDAHWSNVSSAIQANPTEPRSLRAMYRAIYRYDSQYVHAAVASIEAFVASGVRSRELVVIPYETSPRHTNPFTRAASMYALMLLVAEVALGLEDMEPLLDTVFSD